MQPIIKIKSLDLIWREGKTNKEYSPKIKTFKIKFDLLDLVCFLKKNIEFTLPRHQLKSESNS